MQPLEYCHPEVAQPPGSYIWKFCIILPWFHWVYSCKFFSNNFQVLLPGGCKISKLWYREVVQPSGIVFRKLLQKKFPWISTWIGMKIFSNIFLGTTLGPRYFWFMKNWVWKPYTTVPLRGFWWFSFVLCNFFVT